MTPKGSEAAAPARSAAAPATKPKNEKLNKQPKPDSRMFIAEWYGKSFVHMTGDQRREYAAIQLLDKDKRPEQPCPFRSRPEAPVPCKKAGGICSLRYYQRSKETGEVIADPSRKNIVTICPSRFEQDATIYPWINEVVLPKQQGVPVGETPFLRRVPKPGENTTRKAGRIDNIIVVPGTDLQWIAVEKQAVYFSGKEMMLDFRTIAQTNGDAIPFPVQRRRPDFRSSSAKRLLPQLQVKVNTIRSWGKKTAVVVDEDFFAEFGPMPEEQHISIAHIVWFIVRYELERDRFVLKRGFTRMATLENSIQAVLAAHPIPQPEFEQVLKTKLQKLSGARH